MPYDAPESYETALDRVTHDKAQLILAALKADSEINTADMIDRLGEVLGDDNALADLIQRTARGENAFHTLITELATEAARQQAIEELADAPRRRREVARLELAT